MTTAFIPTTRVTILGGAGGETPAGDEVDGEIPLARDVAATWSVRRRSVWDPVQLRHTSVESVRVRLRPGTAVLRGQRLRDQRTGRVGTVDEVEDPRGVMGRSPVVVWLVRVTG